MMTLGDWWMRSALLMLILMVAATIGCDQAYGSRPRSGPFPQISGSTMGTSYRITLSGVPHQLVPCKVHSQIDEICDIINDQMSTYRAESEISRFNRHADRAWFAVSRPTAQVVASAQRISAMCEGVYDVTVGPLVNLWHFGPEQAGESIPSNQQIAEAMARVGYEQIEVRLNPPALRKQRGDIYVDLSAIAKGYAVDRIAQFLDGQSIRGYLIELGGEIRTKGTKNDGSPWRVGIETPTLERRGIRRLVNLGDQAMATSGDYRNYFEKEGRRYTHMIDPRTGRPVDHHLASVTIVADSCIDADALATAVMVLGPDEGYNFAVTHKVAALLIVRGHNGLAEKATPLFRELFSTQSGSYVKTLLVTFVVFAIAIVAMALGVILGKRRLKGTCGGLAGLRDEAGRPACDVCVQPSEMCRGIVNAGEQSRSGQAASSATPTMLSNGPSTS